MASRLQHFRKRVHAISNNEHDLFWTDVCLHTSAETFLTRFWHAGPPHLLPVHCPEPHPHHSRTMGKPFGNHLRTLPEPCSDHSRIIHDPQLSKNEHGPTNDRPASRPTGGSAGLLAGRSAGRTIGGVHRPFANQLRTLCEPFANHLRPTDRLAGRPAG